jgi:predicted nucleic acid-binding protein
VIVVDTDVVSELMRPTPSDVVVRWLSDHAGEDLSTTSVTVAEVLYGIERMPDGRRKELMASTAGEVFTAFAERVLGFDLAAAGQYARVVGRRDRAGRPIDGFDAQIAAICLAHDAGLATRNVKDFEETGVQIIDPWRATA